MNHLSIASYYVSCGVQSMQILFVKSQQERKKKEENNEQKNVVKGKKRVSMFVQTINHRWINVAQKNLPRTGRQVRIQTLNGSPLYHLFPKDPIRFSDKNHSTWSFFIIIFFNVGYNVFPSISAHLPSKQIISRIWPIGNSTDKKKIESRIERKSATTMGYAYPFVFHFN